MSERVDEINLMLYGPEHESGGLSEEVLKSVAKVIREAIAHSVKELITAGLLLADVKEDLPYGRWTKWIESEFTFSVRHADRLINAARSITAIIPFEDIGKIDVRPGAIYKLTAPSVPEGARDDLLNAAQVAHVALTQHVVDGFLSTYDQWEYLGTTLKEQTPRVAGLAIGYSVLPAIVPMLARLESERPEVFDEIEASGCIYDVNGDPIPLDEANERDMRAFVDHDRFERGMRAMVRRESEKPRQIVLLLEGERPMSLNKLYGGKHWAVRHAEVERVRQTVAAALSQQYAGDLIPFDGPVEIRLQTWFDPEDKKPLDVGNITVKPYEDALVALGLLCDDDMRFVGRHVIEVHRGAAAVGLIVTTIV